MFESLRISHHSPIILLILLIAAVMLASCKEDPVQPEEPKPQGFILRENGAQRVSESGGRVLGDIQIVRKAGSGRASEPSGFLSVAFMVSDTAQWITQEGDSLKVSGYDPVLITIQRDPDNKWGFHILAKGEGETHITLTLYRGATLLFESKQIPVSIFSEGIEVTKMRIFSEQGGFVNVSDTVLGELTVPLAADSIPVTIEFYKTNGDAVDLWSNPEVSVTWEIDSPIIELRARPTEPPVLYFKTKEKGSTELRFTLRHDSPVYGKYTIYVSPPIPLSVE